MELLALPLNGVSVLSALEVIPAEAQMTRAPVPRILVLSFYYQPDLSAGSFRATALVRELRDLLPGGSQIEVITTLPNRYHSYAAPTTQMESEPGLRIRRIALPPHTSDMRGQVRAFWMFAIGAWQLTAGESYDVVFATSSRLMTATLGAAIARRCRAKLYLDIRDIFVDTIKDVLSAPWSGLLKPFLSVVERWTMRQAMHINLVSEGFRGYFGTRYSAVNYTFFTNGIDDEFLVSPVQSTRWDGKRLIEVLYAGNVGEGQGLHAILPQLALRMRGRVRFKVIGDGGRRLELIQSLAAAGVTDLVELQSPMPRDKLMEAYLAADVLFMHLNALPAFEKVLPSKIFEYAAVGKPVWAGVAGYAAQFTGSEVVNSAVFKPCDAEDAERAFSQLKIMNVDRVDFCEQYQRRNIMRQMSQSILNYIPMA